MAGGAALMSDFWDRYYGEMARQGIDPDTASLIHAVPRWLVVVLIVLTFLRPSTWRKLPGWIADAAKAAAREWSR
jgi:hypothetical protein